MSTHFPELTAAQKAKLRLTLHWTGGNYDHRSSLSHYNFVVDGAGNVHHAIPLQRNFPPLSAGYAQHTGRANSYNIGIGICGMWGSTQAEALQGRYGPFPLTIQSILAAVDLAADLCKRYDIEVTPQRVRVHSEWSTVDPVTRQNGKWDINCIPHLDLRERLLGDGTQMAGNYLRNEIRQLLAGTAEPTDDLGLTDERESVVDAAWISFLEVMDTADANSDVFSQAFRKKVKELRRLAPFRNMKRPE